MSDQSPDVTERLRVAHEEVEIRAPRWVLDLLIDSTEAVAGADEAPNDLRRDCHSAAKIARSRLEQNQEVDD